MMEMNEQKTGTMLKRIYTTTVYNTALMKNVFCMYCVFLLFLVFFTPHRYEGYYHHHIVIQFIPLKTILRGLKGRGTEHLWAYWYEYFGNLFGNIALFMPMGFLLKTFNRNWSTRSIVLIGALVSITIELVQLTFRIGVCDIDDVILN